MPLLGLSLFLGFYPKPVLDRVQPSVERLVRHVEDRSDYEEPTVSKEGPAVAVEEGEEE